MSEASIEAVLANPRDAAARVALADALVKKRDPRGELIRLQTTLEGRLAPHEREAAVRRCEVLLREHEAAWAAPARGWAEYRYKGGFIQAIRARGAAFVTHAEALFAVEPVEDVTLLEISDKTIAALAKMPFLARVRRLALYGSYEDKRLAALLGSPQLGSLASLTLPGVGAEAAEVIAKSKLGGLRILNLTGASIGDEGAAVIAGAKTLSGLEALYLARSEVSDEGAAAIAGSKWLGSLKTLCLGGNDGIGDEGAAAIAKGRAVGALLRLELNQTAVGDEGAKAIAQSKKLAALRRIDLRQTEVSREGMAALRKRKDLRVLR